MSKKRPIDPIGKTLTKLKKAFAKYHECAVEDLSRDDLNYLNMRFKQVFNGFCDYTKHNLTPLDLDSDKAKEIIEERLNKYVKNGDEQAFAKAVHAGLKKYTMDEHGTICTRNKSDDSLEPITSTPTKKQPRYSLEDGMIG